MLTETEIERIFSWLPYREDWPIDRNEREDNIQTTMEILLQPF